MKFLRAIAAILLLVAFDQYSKYMIVEHLPMHTYYPIVGDVFGLYYLQNEGMSWGMFQGKQIIFLIFTVIVLAVIGYIYIQLLRDSFFRAINICMLFLASGAIGNMIDRIFGGEYLHGGEINFLHGGVVDFLYIKLINFPVFNVADMYVTLSIAVLLILLFTKYRNVELEEFLGRCNQQDETDDDPVMSDTVSKPIIAGHYESVHTDDSSTKQQKNIAINSIFSNEEEEDD